MLETNNRIRAKLAAVLFRQHAIGTLSVPVVSAAVVYILREDVDPWLLILWAAAYVLITLVAVAQCILFFRATPDRQGSRAWLTWHGVVAALSAAPHAAFMISALPHSPPQVQIFLGVLFAGIAAGAIVLFAGSLASALAYCGVTLIGLAAAFAISGGDLGGTLAILVVVYLAFLGNAAYDFHGVLREAIFYRLSTLDAQTRMEQHAYDKGLSEVATSVLEELRNELLPIAVKMGRKRSLAANTTRANLAKATEELSDQDTESDRRQKLAQFVGTAMDRQFDQEAETWQDMQSIFARLEAIEDVLVERDRLAGANWVVEEVDLRDAIEQARAMMQDLTQVKFAVEIDLSVSDVGPVWADHFVLAHILRNLMLSSAQAIGRGAARRGVINISVDVREKGAGRRMADIRIRDNGCGIAPDALEGFLETGYQTEDGSVGWPRFGWCMSSLNRFNGTLSVESEGLGQGATMRVVLPMVASIPEAKSDQVPEMRRAVELVD